MKLPADVALLLAKRFANQHRDWLVAEPSMLIAPQTVLQILLLQLLYHYTRHTVQVFMAVAFGFERRRDHRKPRSPSH